MISIIVAVAENGVIGCANRLIWHLSDDLKRFKSLTMGHPIIMGRKTFESIGRALPGRTNIVVSRTRAAATGQGSGETPEIHSGNSGSLGQIIYASSLEEAVSVAQGSIGGEEVFIIGGAEIYRHSVDLADRVYYTLVNQSPEGDAFFAPLDFDVWDQESRQDFEGHSYINYCKRECCK